MKVRGGTLRAQRVQLKGEITAGVRIITEIEPWGPAAGTGPPKGWWPSRKEGYSQKFHAYIWSVTFMV